MSLDSGSNHWDRVANRWEHVGPPLKPSDAELQFYLQGTRRWKEARAPRVLILGVTQELYKLEWPTGTHVKAMDHSQEMIDQVWLGPAEDAICADWRCMPLDDKSVDIVVSDGGLTMLNPNGVKDLTLELARVCAPSAVCVFRLYHPRKKSESVDDVLRDLGRGKIPNLSCLKLRLEMAMQERLEEGVMLDDVWKTVKNFAPDFDELASQIGWPVDHLRAIETYKKSSNRYYFYTLKELVPTFEPLFRIGELFGYSVVPASTPVVAFHIK